MATFGELWTAIVPAAVAATPPSAAQMDRDVGWVRVLKARVPAFDALDPGDIAIVPGSALAVVAPGPVEIGALVDALSAGRCAGALLIEADGAEDAVGALEVAAGTAGIAALRVGRMDPNQLERSAIGFLLNRRAELEHQAGLLEASLEEIALGSGDVAALIAGVGAFLGRAVALEGRRGEVIAVHAPEHAPGAAAAVATYLAGSRTAALRVPLPAPVPAASSPAAAAGSSEAGPSPEASARPTRATSGGRLVFLGERPPSDLERVVGPRIGRLLALELARADAVRRARTGRRSEVLPSDGPPWAMLLARQVAPGTGLSIEAREEMRSRLRVVASPRRLALRGDAESLELRLVLAAPPETPAGLGAVHKIPTTTYYVVELFELAEKVADLLDRPVALSRPFHESAGRPHAEAEARATLEAIEALPEPPRVARADRLAAYRLLAAMRNLPDGLRHANALLEPLLFGSAATRRERLATLRSILEQPGFAEAAAALGVHRNTLSYRIRRIEQITGWRLADPDLRLPLAMAVRLVQDDQVRR